MKPRLHLQSSPRFAGLALLTFNLTYHILFNMSILSIKYVVAI